MPFNARSPSAEHKQEIIKQMEAAQMEERLGLAWKVEAVQKESGQVRFDRFEHFSPVQQGGKARQRPTGRRKSRANRRSRA